MLVLSVIQGPDKGKVYELPHHEPQLIGRSGEALPITDTTVSRRHAELTPDDGAWYIRDLGSHNGTFVNGVRLTGRARLLSGDQIRVGATLFVFGATSSSDAGVIRVLRPGQMETSIERTLPSGEETLAGAVHLEPTSHEPAAPQRSVSEDQLRILYALMSLTARITDRRELLEQVLELVFAHFAARRGFVLLVDPADPAASAESPAVAAVKYAAAPADAAEAQIHVSRTILRHALKDSEGVLSTNAMTDPRFAAGDSVQRGQVRSAICSPIRFGERVFGVLYADTDLSTNAFSAPQLALLNAIGRHTGLALATMELSDKRLRSERLATIGQTVANLSHSIKNILQGLRGGADVVEIGLKKEDLNLAREGWAILRRNLDRIVGLSLNMLAFSRPRPVEVALTSIGPLIAECVQLLQGPAVAKGVAIITDADAMIPPIPIDAGQIHQCLVNIIANAVEAVEPETGAVTVRAALHPSAPAGLERVGPCVRVEVIDNGPGVPAARQAWIFEPFNTSKGLRGTGLGLPVARRIAREHGGDLTLRSREGEGATFCLFLPLAGPPGTPGDPAATHA